MHIHEVLSIVCFGEPAAVTAAAAAAAQLWGTVEHTSDSEP